MTSWLAVHKYARGHNRAQSMTCGPWHDNIRHLYEAGRDMRTLCHWLSMAQQTLKRILWRTGAKMRPAGFQKRRG